MYISLFFVILTGGLNQRELQFGWMVKYLINIKCGFKSIRWEFENQTYL